MGWAGRGYVGYNTSIPKKITTQSAEATFKTLATKDAIANVRKTYPCFFTNAIGQGLYGSDYLDKGGTNASM